MSRRSLAGPPFHLGIEQDHPVDATKWDAKKCGATPPELAWRGDGAGAVDLRTTSSGSIAISGTYSPPPSMRSTTVCAAISPMRRRGCLTVVSGAGERRSRNAVESHDRNVFRYAEAGFMEGPQRANGGDVVVGEERGEGMLSREVAWRRGYRSRAWSRSLPIG